MRNSESLTTLLENDARRLNTPMYYSELFEAPRTTLPLGKNALPNARDRYGALIAVMAPMDFIRLTTTNQTEIDAIFGHQFTTVDIYDKGSASGPHGELFQKNQYFMPFLNVLYPSGQVTGHEGRHRAAMIIKAGGTSFPVMLSFRSEYRFVLLYQQTNYETEPEETSEHTETFTDMKALEARQQELRTLNNNLDQPFSYGYFRTETEGGTILRGNPERQDRQNPFSYAKWQPSDMPARLIGQYNSAIHVPTSRMRVGSLKWR